MKDKPPTTESANTARKIAERMPKCPKCDLSYYVTEGKCNRCKTKVIEQQYPAALPALPMSKRVSQTDYERGFEQGYHEGHETGYQAGLRKAAEAL